MTRRATALTALTLAAASLVAVGCGSASDDAAKGSPASGGASTVLNLVAYSTPQEAYAKLEPAFAKTPAGKGVSFHESFGPSGDQSRAVESGLPADVVEFSLATDMERLVKAHLVDKDWNAGADRGFVTDSVVVFLVRKGNPKHITQWSDLTKGDTDVIEPNPFQSGGARWNIMAAYGAQKRLGKSDADARKYLQELFDHVSVQDKSAREATQTFVGGKGDVLLAYENEAITAQAKGADVDYVIPDQTILIENPLAVTSEAKHPKQAAAFVDWLHSDAAQKVFARAGYRSVRPALVDAATYPTPKDLFTIDDLGGWSTVKDTFFDPDRGIVAKIEQGKGVSTAR